MNIISDIDGCLLKFTENFLSYYNTKYNKNLLYENMNSYYFPDYGVTKSQIREFCNCVDNLDNYNNTTSLLKYFKHIHKANITLITSIPNTKKIRNHRENNLRTKGIVYDKIIYDDDKQQYLEQLQPVSIVIEDNPVQIDRYLQYQHLFENIIIPIHPWTMKYMNIKNTKIKMIEVK